MQLTVDWNIKTLGEIAEVQSGGTPLKANNKYWSGNIPWYTSGELNETYTRASKSFITQQGLEESNAKLFPKGSLLIGMYDTAALKMSILDRDAAFNQAIAGVKPNENINLKFILYAIDSRRFEILNQRRGVRQKNLSLVKIKSIRLPIPPLLEQKRIVAILDEAFEGIDRAITNTEKNLANIHELFEGYLNAIFTQKGDGWEEKKLGDICELISGQHIDAKDYNTNSQGIGYLTGPSDFGITYPIISKWTEVPKRTAVLNDILITVKGSGVGKINLLHSNEVAISRQLMAVRVKDQNIRFIYAFLSLQFSYFQFLANGTAIPGISRSDVLCLKTPIPSLDVQKEVVDSIEQYHCSAQRLEANYRQKIVALNELKQSILQKAFTGELTADTANKVKKTAQRVNAA